MSRPGLLRLPAQVQDVLLAAFITVMQVQGTAASSSNSTIDFRSLSDFGYLGYALLILSGAVLVFRRRWPVAVFATTAVMSVVYFSAEFPDGPGWLALFIALYTLTAYGDGRRSVRIAAVGIAVLATWWLIVGADVEPREALGWVFFRIGASTMAAALGESIRSRRVIAAEAQQRAEHAERTREEEARRRVDAERLRIARDVHDTVAHAIAIINVQAGVTAHVLDKRPERARDTLVTIEQTSSQALHEMRVILGVLRGSGDEPTREQGLNQLDELAAMAREAELDVKVEVGPIAPDLPVAVDRTAYRILQESITNAIRHAPGARITVGVECRSDVLEIHVADDGGHAGGREDERNAGAEAGAPIARRSNSAAGTGRGIVGMRERCLLLGGELTAGPRAGGGFEVRAHLPLNPAEAVGQ
ncbi:sensor histidine kinase [Phytoactinopolyspora endophytica]|uniref:sensor histidine kinase n=1 Tax=Phytoactinopolyspora endophytica TaxID=1642495 RepID=UPI00101DC493|nr:sensor histidine kinase [Phytoactinopolyspora endophytica]